MPVSNLPVKQETLALLALDTTALNFTASRRIFQEVQTLKFSITQAASVDDILDLIQSHNFDLFVISASHNVDDDLNIIKHLNSVSRHTPIIYLSEHNSFELERRSLEAGVWVFLNKKELNRDQLEHHLHFIFFQNERLDTVRKHELIFRSFIEKSHDVFTMISADGTILFKSPSVERVLGLKPEQLEDKPFTVFVHPDDKDELIARFDCLADKESCEGIIYRFRNGKGDWVWLESEAINLVNDPNVNAIVFSSRDVTKQRQVQAKEELQAQFRSSLIQLWHDALEAPLDGSLYQALLEKAVEVIPGVQAGSLIFRGSSDMFKFVAAVGFDLERLKQVSLSVEESWHDCVSPDPKVVQHLKPANKLAPEKQLLLEKAGAIKELKATLSIPIFHHERLIAVFNLDNLSAYEAFDNLAIDMGVLFAQQAGSLMRRLELEEELKRSRDELYRLAYQDSLTGMPNRNGFLEHLRGLGRGEGSGTLVLIDIDNFKFINDTWGHATGDVLLRIVASRLASNLEHSDVIARWNGDEFLIYAASQTFNELDLKQFLDDIFQESFLVAGRSISVSASAGFVPLSYAKNSYDVLLSYADIALNRAKAEGKKSVRVFDFEMIRSLHLRQRLEEDLRKALEEQSFTLQYQPIINLQSTELIKVEALARWVHSERGYVSPAEFIPLAEETGLIHKLADQLLEQVCKQISQWQSLGHNLTVAFNLSAHQLNDINLVPKIERLAQHYHLNSNSLEFEVTESAAIYDLEGGVKTLKSLRDLGFKIAVDDFGTAYSSLAYLKHLPLDTLKIDRTFITGIEDDAMRSLEDASIVQAIIAMAKSMNLVLVAEGIETQGQARFLKFLGCDMAQGYHFSKPLTPSDLLEWLNR